MAYKQSPHKFLKFLAIILLCSLATHQANSKPNFVIILLDDSGWSDFEPFGNTNLKTPNVDTLAKEGMRLDHFFVPQAICSASRSALLTGSYPGRTQIFGALHPREKGLDPNIPTISEVLKNEGYRTACFGKWHLGDTPETRPQARGFDETCGLMYSNDMWKRHPATRAFDSFPLQFWEDGEITIQDLEPEDQKTLTQRYTQRAVDFISENKDTPFFLYLPHSMPHVPLFCSDAFAGKSGAGAYGDVIMELDWSVGKINQALKANGLEDNTVVIFTSDNGPWLLYGNHAGTTPFKEGKQTVFEGGVRAATILKYPPLIQPESTSDYPLCSVDIFPILASLAGADISQLEIDGKDVWNELAPNDKQHFPHDYFPLSVQKQLTGIVSGDGKWKLILPHSYPKALSEGIDGAAGKSTKLQTELALFDLQTDPYETTDLSLKHPDIAQQLIGYAELHRSRYYEPGTP